ncbi:hypothetical protein AVT26_gp50 [Streptomyces phage Lannister]|uniref:Uncharacterized protein n=1 Tax=Streptomyces phage Lannister TaxID=1674927 RepID=A0A0K1Y9H2_9CAUD|nr:hypothetical protein AVT26_gp50 [Streptomyces phage Lannister]AKY03732.1 hypothetical protein SEA_LANNISTER_50 [Streptomyces phage Lannister]
MERVAEMVMALPEDQREAFLASLVPPRAAPQPTLAVESRPLPPPRRKAVITSSVNWV